MRISVFILLAALCAMCASAAEPMRIGFQVKLDVVKQELNRDYCWFHPRAVALPGFGEAGKPSIIITLQKHLVADDHYSGLYFMKTDDLGKNWSGPTEIQELAWQKNSDGETIAVCDVTPGWHSASQKLIAIGIKLRYSAAGAQLLDKPRSHECAYATYDPKIKNWRAWKMLEMPDTDQKFFLMAPGCVQWLVKPDGLILVPSYFKGAAGNDYTVTVLECTFDGETLQYQRHGDELTVVGGRGLCEPSIAKLGDRYFLTLRNDARGYVTTSDNGLNWNQVQPWLFDDGSELGSYNTQTHWLTHKSGLFLAYTRRGSNNDHIPRHRAPLFLAQVDPDQLRVLRDTEQVLIPERGAMLGNFGAAPITEQESWITDSEFIVAGQRLSKGADGSTFAARVLWKESP